VSLKIIHILFICGSILVTLVFGDWCLRAYLADKSTQYLVLGLLDLAAMCGLLVYIYWFVQKVRSGGFK
jgi:hypothetical protein